MQIWIDMDQVSSKKQGIQDIGHIQAITIYIYIYISHEDPSGINGLIIPMEYENHIESYINHIESMGLIIPILLILSMLHHYEPRLCIPRNEQNM